MWWQIRRRFAHLVLVDGRVDELPHVQLDLVRRPLALGPLVLPARTRRLLLQPRARRGGRVGAAHDLPSLVRLSPQSVSIFCAGIQQQCIAGIRMPIFLGSGARSCVFIMSYSLCLIRLLQEEHTTEEMAHALGGHHFLDVSFC